ncbi:hypothetical protein PBAL39_13597 [Pedobacter sp. BAL39]|nr:hypothetical protein PBAL39_13597 [Pedobacter sp. BAL39]
MQKHGKTRLITSKKTEEKDSNAN